MLTHTVCCCSANRSVDSDGSSSVQTLLLGSEGSAESAETSAAAEQEQRPLPDDDERAREAAATQENIFEQVGYPPLTAILQLQAARTMSSCRGCKDYMLLHCAVGLMLCRLLWPSPPLLDLLALPMHSDPTCTC